MKYTIAGFLLAVASAVQAAPITVVFTYEGANYESWNTTAPEWTPSARLDASFTGEDLNGDNVIGVDELTSLHANGINYLTPDSTTSNYYISKFYYRNPGDYSIDVGVSRYYDPNDGQSGWAGSTSASWSPNAQRWGWGNDGSAFETWTGTSETVASVVSTVPEPASFAMLGLGLSVIGLRHRRAKAAAR